MSAPFTFRGPTVGLGEDEEDPAEAPDEEPDLPPSPDEIQIDAADVGQFDETYLARSQNFKIEGRFSPAPYPLQVIPRVAYTINFNFVWNESRQRWEADTGNGNGVMVLVDSGSITLASASETREGIDGTTASPGGDILFASVTVDSPPNPTDRTLIREGNPDSETAGLIYGLELDVSSDRYNLRIRNDSGDSQELTWAVTRVSP